ncbi:hypothetical protein AC231_05590 [Clostridium pasteurianum]|uniref:hypothetical protein n=1 Tax=Clostridium pasteurianum TaxID=1501 RepID=UPI000975C98B|nr:hypothetical protein [Clostridium pasteurianum]OMH20237.1 hypothetical protein AC231_05590 [Clostridium pasteurianum]
MEKHEKTNYRPKAQNAGNEPKTWSHNPNSAKYHSRSAEFKAKEKIIDKYTLSHNVFIYIVR